MTAAALPGGSGLDATIVLVRHGESDWITKGLFQGQGDSQLSERGRLQARLVARRLATADLSPVLPIPGRAPVAILHSPLARTTSTAAEILTAYRERAPFPGGETLEATPEPGLLEIGQGEWEGRPGGEIAERWGDVLRTWRERPLEAWAPGGESLREVDARVRSMLGTLFARLAAEPVHGPRRRTGVLGYAEDVGDEPWALLVGHDGVFKVVLLALLDLPLDRFWLVPFALCGISVVEIRGGRPRLRLLNSTDHLAALETGAEQAMTEARENTGAL